MTTPRPSLLERFDEVHARIAWGDADVTLAITAARNLVDEGHASKCVLALAALEAVDGSDEIHARLSDVVRELDIALDDASMAEARVRWIARAVAHGDMTIERVLNLLPRFWRCWDAHPVVGELLNLSEDHALALSGDIAVGPAEVLDELRAALMRVSDRE